VGAIVLSYTASFCQHGSAGSLRLGSLKKTAKHTPILRSERSYQTQKRVFSGESGRAVSERATSLK